jgi:hypothetical protein
MTTRKKRGEMENDGKIRRKGKEKIHTSEAEAQRRSRLKVGGRGRGGLVRDHVQSRGRIRAIGAARSDRDNVCGRIRRRAEDVKLAFRVSSRGRTIENELSGHSGVERVAEGRGERNAIKLNDKGVGPVDESCLSECDKKDEMRREKCENGEKQAEGWKQKQRQRQTVQ